MMTMKQKNLGVNLSIQKFILEFCSIIQLTSIHIYHIINVSKFNNFDGEKYYISLYKSELDMVKANINIYKKNTLELLR